MNHSPPFHPQPAEAHMRRWPRIILPTFELSAMERGQQLAPGGIPNSPHICDFSDGIRLVVFVSQAQPGAPEELEVSISAADECEMLGIETRADHWTQVIVERLMDIDPTERPRIMSRTLETAQGVLVALFQWDRAPEERAAATSMQAKRLDPTPLWHCSDPHPFSHIPPAGARFGWNGYLEMFTVYQHPDDYPDRYIVRRAAIAGGEVHLAGAWQASDLTGARACIPQGKMNIGRQPSDLPVIAEAWV